MTVTINGSTGITTPGLTNSGSTSTAGLTLSSGSITYPNADTQAVGPFAGPGSNQSWSNVTGSRSAGTTYTNSTGRPIQVAILSNQTTNSQFKFYINSTLVWDQFSSTIYGDNVSCNFTIPASATYSLTVPYGAIQYWMELR